MSDSQQYLHLIQPARPAMLTEGPTPQEDGTLSRHFDYLKTLAERRIVIFEAESEDAARAIMSNDPAVQAGVRLAPDWINPVSAGVHAKLFPYRIALMADRGGR